MAEYDFTFAHRDEGFDDHIEHSIRGYSNLVDDIVSYSRYFVENGTSVVDLGCSTGKVTEKLILENQDHCAEAHYIGVELAEGFYDNLDKREDAITANNPWVDLEFIKGDIRDCNFTNCSFITSIFTLQFMPPRHRKEVLEKIYKGLNTGGAFIFAEKTVAEDPRVQEMITFNYYDYKRKNFDTEDIMDKERTLRHMMKPNTWSEIVNNLIEAGFDPIKIQPFWRNHMFVGAIVIK
jgi:tRNA (cmo5U34)-methyltransferase